MGDGARTPARLRVGHLEVDPLTLTGAVDAIDTLVSARRGGSVFTPNVDHVVIAERDPEFRAAYAASSLTLADGMPLVWASRLLGRPIPERVAGSDLVLPLARRAAERRWRVYLLGAGPGVAEAAAARLRSELGVEICGTDAPRIRVDGGTDDTGKALESIKAARPDLIFVAFGAPKQEIWTHRHREALRPAVVVGLGATLDFVAGRVRRAPRWVSRCGLEWLWRLTREPSRLWRRYLVDDPRFLGILWRTLRDRRLETAARRA